MTLSSGRSRLQPHPGPGQTWGRRRNRVSQAGQRLEQDSGWNAALFPVWGAALAPLRIRFICSWALRLWSKDPWSVPGSLANWARLGVGEYASFLVETTVLAPISWDLWAPSPAGSDHLLGICQMTQPFGTHFPSLEFFPQCSWEEEKKLP